MELSRNELLSGAVMGAVADADVPDAPDDTELQSALQ